MSGKDIIAATTMEKLCALYENNNPLMPFVAWGLNLAGVGVIDRLICKRASDFEFKQVRNLVAELSMRLDQQASEPRSDNFVPAFNQAMSDLLQTQSSEKARHFASVLAGAWNSEASRWDEVSQTLRLIRQLEDVHVCILRQALELGTGAQESAVTFCVGDSGYSSSIRLDELLPDIDSMLLTSCVSDLIALGLINDSFSTNESFEANVHLGSSPKEAPLAYSISKLGRWLLGRIAAPAS